MRLLTEIQIENANNVDLPKTLLDISIVAPTKDKYRITAGLSHNYSGTTTDSSGIILGTGGSTSSLLISYDTSEDFENAGNVSIAKGGVTLSLADGSSVSEDQDLTAFLSQSYNPATVNTKLLKMQKVMLIAVSYRILRLRVITLKTLLMLSKFST